MTNREILTKMSNYMMDNYWGTEKNMQWLRKTWSYDIKFDGSGSLMDMLAKDDKIMNELKDFFINLI